MSDELKLSDKEIQLVQQVQDIITAYFQSVDMHGIESDDIIEELTNLVDSPDLIDFSIDKLLLNPANGELTLDSSFKGKDDITKTVSFNFKPEIDSPLTDIDVFIEHWRGNDELEKSDNDIKAWADDKTVPYKSTLEEFGKRILVVGLASLCVFVLIGSIA